MTRESVLIGGGFLLEPEDAAKLFADVAKAHGLGKTLFDGATCSTWRGGCYVLTLHGILDINHAVKVSWIVFELSETMVRHAAKKCAEKLRTDA